MKIDGVITLDGNINCLLLDKANYIGDNYFLSVVLDEEEEPTEDYVVLKEIIENNETYVLRETDPVILTELVKSFTKVFNAKVEDLQKNS